MKQQLVLGILLAMFSWEPAAAHYEDTGWITFTQPDGSTFIGRGWGD